MRLLSYDELRSEKGIRWTRVHLARLTRLNKFPKPVKPGEQTVAWIEGEIDQWLEDRAAEREGAPA
jgi:prophage regulatory protein